MSDHFPVFFCGFFFRQLKVKFGNKRSDNKEQRNQTKVCKHAERRNLRNYNMSRDENPQRENKTDSSSFEGFFAQLDCRLTYGNKY